MTATPDTPAETEQHVAVPAPRRADRGESWLERLGWEETG